MKIDNKIDELFEMARSENKLISLGEARSLIENHEMQAVSGFVKRAKRVKRMNIIMLTFAAAAISAWLTFGVLGAGENGSPVAAVAISAANAGLAPNPFISNPVLPIPAITDRGRNDLPETVADNSARDIRKTSGNSTAIQGKVDLEKSKLRTIELSPGQLNDMGISVSESGSLSFVAFQDSKSPVAITLNENDVAAGFVDSKKSNAGNLTPVFITDASGNRLLSLFKSSDGRNYLSFQKEIDESSLENENYLKVNNINKIKADVKIDIEKHKELIESNLADKEIKLDEIEGLVRAIVDETMISIDGKMIANNNVVTSIRLDSLNCLELNLDSLRNSLDLETDFSRNGKTAKVFIRSRNIDSNEEEIEINSEKDQDTEWFDSDSDAAIWLVDGDSALTVTIGPDTTMTNIKPRLNYSDSLNNDYLNIYGDTSSSPERRKIEFKFQTRPFNDSLIKKFRLNINKIKSLDSIIKESLGGIKQKNFYFSDSVWNNRQSFLPNIDSVIRMHKLNIPKIDSILKQHLNKYQNLDSLQGKHTVESKMLNMIVRNGGITDGITLNIKELQAELDEYAKVNKFVAVSVSDKSNPGFKYILWFEPTLDFIENMPAEYRDKLVNEYNASKTDEICNNPAIAGEDTYFDIWKSCSGAVENLNVYPNPVKTQLNVKFRLTDSRAVSISLHNLSGKTISNFKTNVYYQPGDYAEAIKAENLEPGMYLLTVQTDKGEKAVQRIIVE